MKQCSCCKKVLALTEFGKSSKTKDLLKSRCRKCRYTEYRKLKDRDPEAYRKKQRLSTNRYRKANPEKRRSKILTELFGVTLEEYNQQSEVQGHCCAICKLPETSKVRHLDRPKNLSVDHCHSTGILRGLLCHRCNIAIGLLNEDEKRFFEAVQYLRTRGVWKKQENK